MFRVQFSIFVFYKMSTFRFRMGTISQSSFESSLTQFVLAFNAHSDEKWTLHKVKMIVGLLYLQEKYRIYCDTISLIQTHIGLYAKQSVMIQWKDEHVNRQVCCGGMDRLRLNICQAHITYHPTYEVPVLWFNFYRRSESF